MSGTTTVAPPPTSKRDKRRQTLALKLDQITDMFENERDFHYSEMLRTLQSTLYSLHVGDNIEFLEELTDIEEKRDEQLVMLYLWEKYQLERTEQEYNQDLELANDEHRQMTNIVKEKLMAKLESQRRKLDEDKALLDIANDHSFLLNDRLSDRYFNNDGLYSGGSRNLLVPGSPGGRNVNGRSGGYGYNNNSASHLLNGINGGGFSSQSGLENSRRTLRRRGGGGTTYDDYSGLSGGEGSGGGGTGGGTATGRRRDHQSNTNTNTTNNGYRTSNPPNNSDIDNAFSDRDLEGMLFNKEREAPTTRHSSKAYHGVRVLKPEEAQEDINLLRNAIRRSKRG